MKMIIPIAGLKQQLPIILRRAGYQLYRRQEKELVFSRRLSRTNFFPRFHLYLHPTQNAWEGNLHYDLRQTVQAHPVHGEEYDGPVVEDEYNRLWSIINESGQTSFSRQELVEENEINSKNKKVKYFIIGVIVLLIIIYWWL